MRGMRCGCEWKCEKCGVSGWYLYALPCHDFKSNIQEEKIIFKMAKYNQKQHF